MTEETDKKESRKKSFNIDGLSAPNQAFFEEILESTQQSPTKTIDRICNVARKKVEDTAAKPERNMFPPLCGWAIFDEEYGDICIAGLKKPVRRAILPWRQIKYLKCEICELLTLKRKEQKILEKIEAKPTLPLLINDHTAYKAQRDITLIAQRYKTLSPSEISQHIKEDRGEDRTPASISMWLMRHPEETALLTAYIEVQAKMSDEEKKKALDDLQIILKEKKKPFVPLSSLNKDISLV
jgi:hypothetical protein